MSSIKKTGGVSSITTFGPPKSGDGFIALISIIILGFVLFIVVLTLGSRSIGTRFLLLDLERKDASKALAEGCAQFAIIAIINDPTYTVPNTNWTIVPIGSSKCAIYSLSPVDSTQSLIIVTASSSGATTNLELTITNSSGAINSWRELANLP